MAFNIGSLVARVKMDTSDIAIAERKVDKSTKEMSKDLGRVKKSSDAVSKSFGGLATAIGAVVSFQVAKSAADSAEKFTLLDVRIKNATKSVSDYNKAQKELFNISNQTGTAIDDVVRLFEGITIGSQELGRTNDEVLQLTATLNQLGVIGGSSATQMSNAMLQFGQAMAGGIVRAEEFNSIVENTPRIAKAIGDGLGKSVGELRKMVIDGKLLANDVFNALLKQQAKVKEQFQTMPETIGRSMNQMTNQIGILLKSVNDEFKITGFIASTIKGFAEDISKLRAGFENREVLQAANEWADLQKQVAQNQAKLNAALNEKGASIQNINRINALTEEQIKLEDELLAVEQRLAKFREEQAKREDAAAGTGATISITKKTQPPSKDQLKAAKKAAEEQRKALEYGREQQTLGQEALREMRAEAALEYGKEQQRLGEEAIAAQEAQLERERQIEEERIRIGQATLDARARQFEQERFLREESSLQILQSTRQTSEQFLQLLEDGGKQSTALYKALFLFSKAAAVAEIIVSTNVAAAKTEAALAPFGKPAAETIRTAGYTNAAITAGMGIAQTFNGGGREFGGTVVPNAMHRVGEKGKPELYQHGSDQYLIGGSKGGKVTPLKGMESQQANIQVTVIADKERAGTVEQNNSGDRTELKVFVESVTRSTVSNDIIRGGNKISRALSQVGLQRRSGVNG